MAIDKKTTIGYSTPTVSVRDPVIIKQSPLMALHCSDAIRAGCCPVPAFLWFHCNLSCYLHSFSVPTLSYCCAITLQGAEIEYHRVDLKTSLSVLPSVLPSHVVVHLHQCLQHPRSYQAILLRSRSLPRPTAVATFSLPMPLVF